MTKLQPENVRLKCKREQAQAIIDVQEISATFWGLHPPGIGHDAGVLRMLDYAHRLTGLAGVVCAKRAAP